MWWVVLALAAGGRGTDNRQARALGEAVNSYWEGVRWNSPGKAQPYLGSAESRVRLEQVLTDAQVKLTDAVVLAADLEPDPGEGQPRPAVVLVRIEVVDLGTNRMETISYVQHWTEVGTKWFVDETKSPLGTDRAWVIAPPAAQPAPGQID